MAGFYQMTDGSVSVVLPSGGETHPHVSNVVLDKENMKSAGDFLDFNEGEDLKYRIHAAFWGASSRYRYAPLDKSRSLTFRDRGGEKRVEIESGIGLGSMRRIMSKIAPGYSPKSAEAIEALGPVVRLEGGRLRRGPPTGAPGAGLRWSFGGRFSNVRETLTDTVDWEPAGAMEIEGSLLDPLLPGTATVWIVNAAHLIGRDSSPEQIEHSAIHYEFYAPRQGEAKKNLPPAKLPKKIFAAAPGRTLSLKRGSDVVILSPPVSELCWQSAINFER